MGEISSFFGNNSMTILLLLALLLIFLPAIVALTRSRLPLQTAAVILSILSPLTTPFGFQLFGLVSPTAEPVPLAWLVLWYQMAGALWFAGLLCGITAFLGAQAERRTKDAVFRIIYNEPAGLNPPKAVLQHNKKKRKNDAAPS